ncbi:MAG TPA: YdcF family protein, partial [Acidimicrobiia bacterium]|nr:YdcF family protein [Acidimicrobiia bacterium]
MAATVVLLTFAWFVFPSTLDVDEVQSADAVVVFAGSRERLETAVELMESGAAPNLVIPNGNTRDVGTDLCDGAPFQVFCPDTGEISTWGEAQAIGRLAEEQGWTRLIAVTSVYHVHRATSLLRRCHDGPVDVVSPPRDIDRD